MNGRRLTIAVDLDDVLAHSAEGFVAYSNRKWSSQLEASDYSENWPELWGVAPEEALARARQLETSGAFLEYASIGHALPMLRSLKRRYRLIILTSRRRVTGDGTRNWLEQHFPGIFEDVQFAGIWEGDDVAAAVHRTKAEACHSLAADFLIDDQPKHCIGAAEAGIPALLFGDYSWNVDHDAVSLPELVTRVSDWHQVYEYFDGLDRIRVSR